MIIADIIINALQYSLNQPNRIKSVIIAVALVLYLCVIGILFRFLCKPGNKKFCMKNILCIVLIVDMVLGCWILVPFLDGSTKTETPVLLAAVKGPDNMVCEGFYCEYEVQKWPFSLTPYNNPEHYQQTLYAEVPEFEQARSYMTDLDNYTYVVSYGRKITSLQWSIWNSTPYFPPPWRCNVKFADIETAPNYDSCFYIYRIDKAVIEQFK